MRLGQRGRGRGRPGEGQEAAELEGPSRRWQNGLQEIEAQAWSRTRTKLDQLPPAGSSSARTFPRTGACSGDKGGSAENIAVMVIVVREVGAQAERAVVSKGDSGRLDAGPP